jgi:natural product biosynthesis luciferase-like monooxygenase protein
MKFGIFWLGSSPHRKYKETYAEILEQVEYAEELGYDSVWLTEHHRSEYGTFPSPAVMAAAIAERTKKVRIGIGVSILPFQNPVRIAEEWAMVDVLSGGRVNFGAGRGYQPREFEVMGADINVSREVFIEALDIIRGLWALPDGELFSYHGEYYDFTDIEALPRPIQNPMPIWVAAVSPSTFGLVAERGLQVITGPGLQSLDKLKEGNIAAARVLIEHGRDPATIDFPMHAVVYIRETAEKAQAEFAGPIEWYFGQLNKTGIHPAHAGAPPKGYDAYLESAKRMSGNPTLDGAIESGIALVTDPENARARVRELRDDIGLKQFLCVFNIGDISHREVMESMRIWAEEVMPEFNDEETPVPEAFTVQPSLLDS